MEIQIPLPRHPCGKAEAGRQNAKCLALRSRKLTPCRRELQGAGHSRVAARRQTAANFSPLFQVAALCREAATMQNRADIPGIKPLGSRNMQKSLISRILPHPPAFYRGEGYQWRILYRLASLAVGLCRNMSEYVGIFLFFHPTVGPGDQKPQEAAPPGLLREDFASLYGQTRSNHFWPNRGEPRMGMPEIPFEFRCCGRLECLQ